MDYAEFEKKLPIPFNEQQREAVRAVDGPVLLLAVPGSGKTTVLVARLGYMALCRGIAPENILTVTYTVAAAGDMRRRFASFFGEELAQRMEFRTINGICAKIIGLYSHRIGKRPFQLADQESRTGAALRHIYREVQGEHPTPAEIKDVRTQITFIKNMMLTPDYSSRTTSGCRKTAPGLRIGEICRRYNQWLRQNRLMDYDDQMVYALNILRRSPELLDSLRNRYRYICVDEAQDTSLIQHEIIDLLAGERADPFHMPSGGSLFMAGNLFMAGDEDQELAKYPSDEAGKGGNLFMVGDEDQSIYGFRAAFPQALTEFESRHPGARVLFMEENFRSTGNIVRAADRLIQRNSIRHSKHMSTSREEGAQIREIPLRGRRAQYSYLARVAQDCREQTAVLYRNNDSAVPLADRLDREGIRFQLKKSSEASFFKHRTVLDIRCFLRLCLNPSDEESFLQIYYKLGAFLKKEQAAWACGIARKQGIGILAAAVRHGDLPSRTAARLNDIQREFREMKKDRGGDAVGRIITRMGYGDYLGINGMADNRIFHLRTIGASTSSPAEFLTRLDYLENLFENGKDDPDCPFLLSTIHSSKGLEYDAVYLIDVIDGLFPEADRSEAGTPELEEERRIFYVGVTRAKNRLNVFTGCGGSAFADELFGREGRTGRDTKSSKNDRRDLRVTASDQRNYASKKPGNANSKAKSHDSLPAIDYDSYGDRPEGTYGVNFPDEAHNVSFLDEAYSGSFPEEAYSENFPEETYGIQRGTRLSPSALRKPYEGLAQEEPIPQEQYESFCARLGSGLIVRHARYGEGVITEMGEKKLNILFDSGEERTFSLPRLYAGRLLDC